MTTPGTVPQSTDPREARAFTWATVQALMNGGLPLPQTVIVNDGFTLYLDDLAEGRAWAHAMRLEVTAQGERQEAHDGSAITAFTGRFRGLLVSLYVFEGAELIGVPLDADLIPKPAEYRCLCGELFDSQEALDAHVEAEPATEEPEQTTFASQASIGCSDCGQIPCNCKWGGAYLYVCPKCGAQPQKWCIRQPGEDPLTAHDERTALFVGTELATAEPDRTLTAVERRAESDYIAPVGVYGEPWKDPNYEVTDAEWQVQIEREAEQSEGGE